MQSSIVEVVMNKIIYLHGQPAPVAQFLRIGSSGHRRLEQFLAAGQLPYQRFIFDAGMFERQKDLIAALRQDGRELVLDTNVAELSVVGRYKGAAQGAPWANPDGILTEAHLRVGANEFDLLGKIARFAVQHGVRRVMAPAHLLSEATDRWLKSDIEACCAFRVTLDREGGRDVIIDYPLMVSNASLNDVVHRRAFVTALKSMPVDSVWLKVSGFGGDATAAGLRKYIAAAQDFHLLQKPIIAECVGGLSGLAILAFGAAGGIAHGLAEKERFDATDWHKPPKPLYPDRKRGGNAFSVLLPGIDRLLKPDQAQILINASGGRRLLSCNDRRCCPRGFEDAIRDPKGHYLRQRAWQCEALSKVPEARRAQDFLDNTLAAADRTARQAAKLRVADEAVALIVRRNAERFDRLRVVLENLNETVANSSRSVAFPPPIPLKTARDGGRG
jgi:hypothetical protein